MFPPTVHKGYNFFTSSLVIFCILDSRQPNGWGGLSLWFWFAYPWWLAVLSVLSCASRPPAFPLFSLTIPVIQRRKRHGGGYTGGLSRPDPEVEHITLMPLDKNSVTWPHFTAWDSGKCSPVWVLMNQEVDFRTAVSLCNNNKKCILCGYYEWW